MTKICQPTVVLKPVVCGAEEKKCAKYASLSSMYELVPMAVETFGAIGEAALNFMKDVGVSQQ